MVAIPRFSVIRAKHCFNPERFFRDTRRYKLTYRRNAETGAAVLRPARIIFVSALTRFFRSLTRPGGRSFTSTKAFQPREAGDICPACSINRSPPPAEEGFIPTRWYHKTMFPLYTFYISCYMYHSSRKILFCDKAILLRLSVDFLTLHI